MKKKSTSQSAFLNLRVLFGLFVMLAGVFLALVGFGTSSSVFAQNGPTREQMAFAMAKALDISNPPACVAGQEIFNDVPASNPFCPFIEELARSGITGGCAPGLYCPGDPVTRQQMAVFLVKTLDFPNKGNSNTAIGEDAFVSDTTGSFNSAFGAAALSSNTTGGGNTAVGGLALNKNNVGFNNTATGASALTLNIGGFNNTANGAGALGQNQSGASNTAMGHNALANNTASFNTAVGDTAAFHQTSGSSNTAVGRNALSGPSGATVSFSTAIGAGAMQNSQTASTSVAVGNSALQNSNGLQNVAVGFTALEANNAGAANTAIGGAALNNLSSGVSATTSSNTALGFRAGFNLALGTGNVYIGRGMEGIAVETDHTYIRNLNTDTVTGAGTDFLNVDLATGRVGHNSSSRRYKEDIKPMDKASEALYRLKPVTYRYKKEINPRESLEYGLVAEDVAEADPNLAIRDGKGQIESVRYTAVNAMLLNEFLKEHKKVEEQQASIAELRSTVAQQQKGIEVLTAQLKEQGAQIQKVSAEVQTSKSTTKVALNNH